MIGNDVVDLQLATLESNWKRKGWLDIVFTKKEQKYIQIAENKATMVWILWSCKEAAYKIYNRETKIRAFIPLQLECSKMNIESGFGIGTVHIKGFVFHTKTIVTNNFIHSTAVSDKKLFEKIRIDFSEKNNLFKPYKVEKDEFGIPFFKHPKSSFEKLLSISHHGRYCSYIST